MKISGKQQSSTLNVNNSIKIENIQEIAIKGSKSKIKGYEYIWQNEYLEEDVKLEGKRARKEPKMYFDFFNKHSSINFLEFCS